MMLSAMSGPSTCAENDEEHFAFASATNLVGLGNFHCIVDQQQIPTEVDRHSPGMFELDMLGIANSKNSTARAAKSNFSNQPPPIIQQATAEFSCSSENKAVRPVILDRILKQGGVP